jgi:hypothetical protein
MTGSAFLGRNRILRRLLALVVTPMALVVLSAAPASAAVTVTAGAAELTNRLLITVPVSVVCDPLPNIPFGDFVGVEIVQASGQEINRASGYLSDYELFICDGDTVNDVVVQAFPEADSGPFHGGPAIATIRVIHSTAESCGPSCFWMVQNDYGLLGPIPIHLRG